MTRSLAMGIGLTLLAGMMSGNCMLPMKFNRRWRWEHIWFVFSVVSLVVLPWALAFVFVDRLLETYRSLSFLEFAVPILFGMGWGVAQVLFGISVQRLGLGLAYAIIVGLGALLGTLVPLVVQHRAQIHGNASEILVGIVLLIAGISLSTWSGQIRERDIRGRENAGRDAHGHAGTCPASRYVSAVLLSILCGVLAPMLNFSFAFGQKIAQTAVQLGNSELRASYAVWPIGLAGGFVPNIVYSLYALRRNRNWTIFRHVPNEGSLPVLMAILWMGAFALYGMSAYYLGPLGTSLGWGLFQVFMIITATLSGVWTREWKHASRTSILLLVFGLACLAAATGLLACGNR